MLHSTANLYTILFQFILDHFHSNNYRTKASRKSTQHTFEEDSTKPSVARSVANSTSINRRRSTAVGSYIPPFVLFGSQPMYRDDQSGAPSAAMAQAAIMKPSPLHLAAKTAVRVIHCGFIFINC